MTYKNKKQFQVDQQGSAAIEFAILGPVFILILQGIVAFGIYFGAAHSVQQLAADAARTAISGLDETERVQLTTRFIDSNGGEYALVDPKYLQVSVSDSNKDASQFKVTLRFDAASLPIWNLYKDLPLPGRMIKRSATIRIGGQ